MPSFGLVHTELYVGRRFWNFYSGLIRTCFLDAWHLSASELWVAARSLVTEQKVVAVHSH